MIKLIIFDLDGTLYPEENAITLAIRNKTIKKLAFKNNISYNEAKSIYTNLGSFFSNPYYGLSSVNVFPYEYRSIFNSINVNAYLKTDPLLQNFFCSLNCQKIILTLSPYCYAKKVLCTLGVFEYIDKLISVDKAGEYKKDSYFFQILKESGISESEICNIGNSFENDIKAAQLFDFRQILISSTPHKKVYTINTLIDLTNDTEIKKILYSRKV